MASRAYLGGRSVLVVEDDYFQATDIAAALKSFGAKVLGPCPTEAKAIAELDAMRPDVALLDINFGRGPSFELAKRLLALHVPFVFLTGYDSSEIPQEFRFIDRLEKPAEIEEIIDMIERLACAPADALIHYNEQSIGQACENGLTYS